MNCKPNILVTGGAGFIGSHLVERLLNAGNRVCVLDDLSTGSLDNLKQISSHSSLKIITSQLSAYKKLSELVENCDYIYHLAAAVGVELVVKHPIATIQTNLNETAIILEAAKRHKKPILITSTSEVYGKSAKAAFAEDDDLLIGPPHLGRWSYACSKLMDEFLAMAYAKEHGLPIVIARLFNTVGPRQTGRFGMVLPRFISAAKKGKAINVYGSGAQTRCFCWVHDTVEALIRLQNTPNATGQIVNIGSTEEVSIFRLANMVKMACHSTSPIQLIPYKQVFAEDFEDMPRRKPVVKKLKKLTGYAPTTSLEDIIKRLT